MRTQEKYVAAIALAACLFFPYYVEIPPDGYLLLLLFGGPVPVWSPLACVVAAICLVIRPGYAVMPALQWLAAWLVGLFVLLLGRATPFVPWWPWVAAPLAGAWALSVALRARSRDRNHAVSTVD